MKIQYASDLHLEFADNWRYLKDNPLQVTGEVLVLAGDIGYLGDDNYTKHPFWDWASDNYYDVIVCMGNHEFYMMWEVDFDDKSIAPTPGQVYKEGDLLCAINSEHGMEPVYALWSGKIVEATADQGKRVAKGETIAFIEK